MYKNILTIAIITLSFTLFLLFLNNQHLANKVAILEEGIFQEKVKKLTKKPINYANLYFKNIYCVGGLDKKIGYLIFNQSSHSGFFVRSLNLLKSQNLPISYSIQNGNLKITLIKSQKEITGSIISTFKNMVVTFSLNNIIYSNQCLSITD